MSQAVYVALSGVILLAVVASVVLWIRQIAPFWSQGPRAFAENLVPVRARWRPFWGVAEVLIMFGSMLALGELLRRSLLARGLLPPVNEFGVTQPENAEQAITLAISTTAAGLGAVAIVLAWMRLIDRDARRKLGLTFSLADGWLGLRAAVMILPPVLLLSAAANQIVEYEHPVLQSLTEYASPAVFAVFFVCTAIATPIVEEVMLRGMLQGALQGLADRASDPGGIDPKWRPTSFWPIVLTSLIFRCFTSDRERRPSHCSSCRLASAISIARPVR